MSRGERRGLTHGLSPTSLRELYRLDGEVWKCAGGWMYADQEENLDFT